MGTRYSTLTRSLLLRYRLVSPLPWSLENEPQTAISPGGTPSWILVPVLILAGGISLSWNGLSFVATCGYVYVLAPLREREQVGWNDGWLEHR